MSRRRGGPGLLRTAARTAVISSTATAASRATSNALDRRAVRSQQTPQADISASPVPSEPMQAPTTMPTDQPQVDFVAQLAQLAQLRDTGALSEDEFQTAKAKLLS